MIRMSNYIIKLKNKGSTSIGRASDMVWIGFGNTIKIRDFRGIEVKKEEYALHIQCPWRIIKDNKIILANYDIYVPKNCNCVENFDWDVKGKNLFDEKIIKLKEKIINSVVRDVTYYEYGDVNIFMENDYQINVFVNGSNKEEYWRFIDNTENKHIICFEER